MFLTGFTVKSDTTTNKNKEEDVEKNTVKNNETNVSIPFLQRDFIGFKEAIAFKESQGKYRIVNKLGYLGKYQFGKTTLRFLKIYDFQHFLNSPKLQEKAFVALFKVNKWILRNEIDMFTDKEINGIKITESGILAAAHLAGAKNVKKFLNSSGKNKFRDAFGTSISHYMKKFSDYDVSYIKANKKPIIINN